MSLFKYFAPPEWDNDVPEGTQADNLTKKFKVKKSKKVKNEISEQKTNGNDASTDNHIQNSNHEQSKKSMHEIVKSKLKKKKHDNSEPRSNFVSPKLDKSKFKKKKHENTGSYIKFESPSLDASLERNVANETASTPLSKNSLKKKQRKLKSGLNVITSRKNDIKSANMNGNDSSRLNANSSQTNISNLSQNSADVSLKTLKNRKRRAKKNKKHTDNSNASVENLSIKYTTDDIKPELKKNKKHTDDSMNVSVENLNVKNITDIKSKSKKKAKKNRKSEKLENSINSSSTTLSNNIQNGEENNSADANVKTSSPVTKTITKPKLNKVKSFKLSDKKSKAREKIMKILNNVAPANSENNVNSEDSSAQLDNSEILANINNEITTKPVNRSKSLREKMMEKLKGARFRYLNEQMYRKQSTEASQIFREDPGAFEAYHEGYRQQINKWPLNPLDVIIKDISKMPKDFVIADLGCGDARLAQSVKQKVHSFDLVSLNPTVTACDMSHTPLLTEQVDVVVFCLSLMGVNLKDYIMEANRVLKTGGLLKIAEVESRFENVDQFTSDIQKYGFSLTKKDFNNDLFYFIDFKKEGDAKKRNKLPPLSLNPCFYKKR